MYPPSNDCTLKLSIYISNLKKDNGFHSNPRTFTYIGTNNLQIVTQRIKAFLGSNLQPVLPMLMKYVDMYVDTMYLHYVVEIIAHIRVL